MVHDHALMESNSCCASAAEAVEVLEAVTTAHAIRSIPAIHDVDRLKWRLAGSAATTRALVRLKPRMVEALVLLATELGLEEELPSDCMRWRLLILLILLRCYVRRRFPVRRQMARALRQLHHLTLALR